MTRWANIFTSAAGQVADQEILDASDTKNFDPKRQKLASTDETLNRVRCAGYLVVAAFFGAEKEEQRKDRRDELLAPLTEYPRSGNMSQRPTAAEKTLAVGPKSVTPFHEEIEFPAVFGRELR